MSKKYRPQNTLITISTKFDICQEDKNIINTYCDLQGCVTRAAYQKSKHTLDDNSIINDIKINYKNLSDYNFIESAVARATAMRKADNVLGVRTRIFGGKKNLERRSKGLITNKEFKDMKRLPIYVIGRAKVNTKKFGGNYKFEFHEDYIIFKPIKGIKIIIPIIFNKNWQELYDQVVIATSKSEIPVTVTLTDNKICLTFDTAKLSTPIERKIIKDRYAGIDFNPNYIGVSVFDKDGSLVGKKLFDLSELTGKDINNNKLDHETSHIGHGIGKWLTHLQVEFLFIEQLTIQSQDHNKGVSFNRLCNNQWKRNLLERILNKYFKLFEVNPVYSSFIGNINNPQESDPIAASMEIARRGYEVIILKKSKGFYPKTPTKSYLCNLRKEYQDITKKDLVSWKSLYDWVKTTGLKYRGSLPSSDLFRLFSSHKSNVLIYM